MSTIEQAKYTVLINHGSFRPKFYEWLCKNFHVYEYFERSALHVVSHGYTHYSARTIVEVMRHQSAIREIDGKYKINDHCAPDLARLFAKLNPEHKDLFNFRARSS